MKRRGFESRISNQTRDKIALVGIMESKILIMKEKRKFRLIEFNIFKSFPHLQKKIEKTFVHKRKKTHKIFLDLSQKSFFSSGNLLKKSIREFLL